MAFPGTTLLDIRSGNESLDLWKFIDRFSWLSRKQATKRDYLEITKCQNPQLNAILRSALNLGDLRADWYGIKSVYELV
jgi:hypothetical protein